MNRALEHQEEGDRGRALPHDRLIPAQHFPLAARHEFLELRHGPVCKEWAPPERCCNALVRPFCTLLALALVLALVDILLAFCFRSVLTRLSINAFIFLLHDWDQCSGANGRLLVRLEPQPCGRRSAAVVSLTVQHGRRDNLGHCIRGTQLLHVLTVQSKLRRSV